MRGRRLLVIAWMMVMLALLAVGYAAADTSAGNPRKGKPGDACKVDSDCDQSSQPQACRQSKCQVDYPPPPT